VADGKTGTFDYATTYIHKDGIIVGEHKVVVQCINSGQQAHNLVPDEVGLDAKTTLRVKTGELPLIIKVPKPQRSKVASRSAP
jgi:hypothetical protein